jgi:hypothetical protein
MGTRPSSLYPKSTMTSLAWLQTTWPCKARPPTEGLNGQVLNEMRVIFLAREIYVNIRFVRGGNNR